MEKRSLTLFINTSDGLKLALLDQNFIPIEKIYIETMRAGNILHEQIYQLLTKNKFEIDHLKNVITIAGPGSYTGLRFSEGIGQIFDWNHIHHFSCLLYEIPSFVDKLKNYSFFMPAFKNEVLLVKYENQDFDVKRFKKDEFDIELKSLNLETAFGIGCLDINSFFDHNITKIVNTIINDKIKRPIFYFREISEEFNKSKK